MPSRTGGYFPKWPSAWASSRASRTPARRDIFIEHARLSAVGNDGSRAFDIGGLGTLRQDEYSALLPTRWPVPAGPRPAAPRNTPPRLFADGRFFHGDGRARFIATPPRAPAHAPDDEFPLVLNTGRIRDQWHTMTRSGKSARLMAHLPEPYVDMHAQDALLAGLRVGEFVRVTTHWGSMTARLCSSGELPRRMIFVPIHWSDALSAGARVGALVNPTVDAVSGEPEFKHTPARVDAFVVSWQGFVLSRRPGRGAYWMPCRPTPIGWNTSIAAPASIVRLMC